MFVWWRSTQGGEGVGALAHSGLQLCGNTCTAPPSHSASLGMFADRVIWNRQSFGEASYQESCARHMHAQDLTDRVKGSAACFATRDDPAFCDSLQRDGKAVEDTE